MTAPTPVISWEVGSAACTAAIEHAETRGWRINVEVVDRGGNVMASVRMPGGFLHSVDIAIDKAYTVASFRFPTKDWMSVIRHDEGMTLGFAARPRLVVFGGGLPIRAGNDWIDTISVSGASESDDEACAAVGLEVIAPSVSR